MLVYALNPEERWKRASVFCRLLKTRGLGAAFRHYFLAPLCLASEKEKDLSGQRAPLLQTRKETPLSLRTARLCQNITMTYIPCEFRSWRLISFPTGRENRPDKPGAVTPREQNKTLKEPTYPSQPVVRCEAPRQDSRMAARLHAGCTRIVPVDWSHRSLATHLSQNLVHS